MATTYTVKSGDNLWSICQRFSSSISGSTIQEKIQTVMKLNPEIKKSNLIYPGQVFKLSGSTGSDSGGGAASTIPTKITVDAFGLKASDTTGRAMFITWSFKREHTKNYEYIIYEYRHEGDAKKWLITGSGSTEENKDDDSDEDKAARCFHEWSATADALKTRIKIIPVSATHKQGDKDVEYWTDDKPEWVTQDWDFSNNPPQPPSSAPSIEIDDKTITMKYESIDAEKLNAKYVQFNIVKDNKSSVYMSPNCEIETNYVSHQWSKAVYGSDYKVRARTIASNDKESGWTDYSANKGTKPSAPKEITECLCKKRSDGTICVYLEWAAVTNATKYKIEYVTNQDDFENSPQNIQSQETADARTSIELTNIETGKEYYFRVRAYNSNSDEPSEPTTVVSIPVGEAPAAPTTWSSSSSAFEGETMELMWTHNARDGSSQTFADLQLKIGESDWLSYIFENTTSATSGDQTDVDDETCPYGQAISYRGELYFKMDTTHADLTNKKITWRVRTAGITGGLSNNADDWSVERIIYIYEKPVLELTISSDLAGQNSLPDVELPAEEGGSPTIVENALTTFPFYIRGVVDLESYKLQKPIGYHLRVVADSYYETIDATGKNKVVNPGDAVYSKYFDVVDPAAPTLIVEMSADNIDLESGITYTVHCAADMSTGLSVEQEAEFNVLWTDVSYVIDADIIVDQNTYTASITPYCVDTNGDYIDNLTLSVYRREYDGTLTQIAVNVPNDGTSVSDPHPALDYARYRLVAKDTLTGAISFYDKAGYKVGCTSVVIQWDEEWSTFDTAENNSVEGPPWSGSMLILPYNISVSDERTREVSFANYAGRERPVAYYGTAIDETTSWSTEIPRTDTETIYALRRLSLWAGNVYVREPSGMGFWANVVPSFSLDYGSVIVPVSLAITRVEGGA